MFLCSTRHSSLAVFIAERLPTLLAPNTITLCDCFSLSMHVNTQIQSDIGTKPREMVASFKWCLFVHMTLDNVDGQQARQLIHRHPLVLHPLRLSSFLTYFLSSFFSFHSVLSSFLLNLNLSQGCYLITVAMLCTCVMIAPISSILGIGWCKLCIRSCAGDKICFPNNRFLFYQLLFFIQGFTILYSNLEEYFMDNFILLTEI